MNLLLIRDTYTKESTIGKLYIDGKYECDTLEDVVREEKIFGETAIPEGEYTIILNLSSRFKKILPLLLNVPSFEGIRIHSGNNAEDTHGCILVGVRDKKDWIGNSKKTFISLMLKLIETQNKKEKITIRIKNG